MRIPRSDGPGPCWRALGSCGRVMRLWLRPPSRGITEASPDMASGPRASTVPTRADARRPGARPETEPTMIAGAVRTVRSWALDLDPRPLTADLGLPAGS